MCASTDQRSAPVIYLWWRVRHARAVGVANPKTMRTVFVCVPTQRERERENNVHARAFQITLFLSSFLRIPQQILRKTYSPNSGIDVGKAASSSKKRGTCMKVRLFSSSAYADCICIISVLCSCVGKFSVLLVPHQKSQRISPAFSLQNRPAWKPKTNATLKPPGPRPKLCRDQPQNRKIWVHAWCEIPILTKSKPNNRLRRPLEDVVDDDSNARRHSCICINY